LRSAPAAPACGAQLNKINANKKDNNKYICVETFKLKEKYRQKSLVGQEFSLYSKNLQ